MVMLTYQLSVHIERFLSNTSQMLSAKRPVDIPSSYQNSHQQSVAMDVERDGSLDRSSHALLASPTSRPSVTPPAASGGQLSPSQNREFEGDRDFPRVMSDRHMAFNTGSSQSQGVIAKIQSYLCCLKIFFTPFKFIADACLFPGRSWADYYYGPLRYLSFAPTWGMCILLAIYLVIMILMAPFWLLSFILGGTGAFVVFLALVLYGARVFARFMSFPGASASLQRDLATDYIQRLVMQLHDFAALSAQFAILVASHEVTRKQLGAQFNITGDGGLSANHGATSITKRAGELGRWVDAMRKLHTFIGRAMDEFKQEYNDSLQGANSAVYANAYTPPSMKSTSFLEYCLRPVLRYVTRKGTARSSALANLNSKADADKAVDPLVSLHHVLGSLLVCATVLVSYVNEHAEAYSPNEVKKSKNTGPKISAGNTEPTANSANTAVINSIGLTVRTAEALRASVQYVIEQTNSGSEQHEAGGLGAALLNRLASSIPALQGGVQSVLRLGEGPSGPARLSSFIMRSQLCGTYNARRFTVVGEDGNRIDCVCFPGSTEKEKAEEKRRKRAAKRHKRAGNGNGGGGGRGGGGKDSAHVLGFRKQSKTAMSYNEEEQAESDDYDSDDTSATGASYSTAASTISASVAHSAPSHANANANATANTNANANADANASATSVSEHVLLANMDGGDGGASGARFAANPNGTVLYCAPNAGMYESFSMIPETSSWLGYYANTLGMDMVFFNYRGYNLSTGVPTPDRIKADGRSVYAYVKNVMGVRNLIVHGESVGGMVATHIAAAEVRDSSNASINSSATSSGSSSRGSGSGISARDADVGDIELHLAESGTAAGSGSYGYAVPGRPEAHRSIIKALVCDRTFASLDAVAGRLLGSWAAAGLWYLGCWYTNSVADYLEIPGMPIKPSAGPGAGAGNGDMGSDSQVMKIMLQDPSDAIVSFCSSMQAGVASVIAGQRMGRGKNARALHWWPSKMNTALAAANFAGKAPVIAASVIDTNSSTSNPMVSNGESEAAVDAAAAAGGSISERLEFNFNSPLHDFQSTFTACIIHLAQLAQKERADCDREQQLDAMLGANSVTTLSSYAPSIIWVQKFCSQPLGIPLGVDATKSAIAPAVTAKGDLTGLEKMLAVLLRTENCTGHTIGEVVLQHADHAHYHAHSKQELEQDHEHSSGNSSPHNSESSHVTAQVYLPGMIFSTTDCSSSAVYEGLCVWISSAITFRHCCIHSHRNQAKGSPSTYSRSLSQSAHDLRLLCDVYAAKLRYPNPNANANANSSHSPPTGAGRKRERRAGAAIGLKLSEQDISCLHYLHNALEYIHNTGSNENVVNMQASKSSHSGYLLSVSCGHSGWPEKKALYGLTACLGRAGFPIPAFESPASQFDALFPKE